MQHGDIDAPLVDISSVSGVRRRQRDLCQRAQNKKQDRHDISVSLIDIVYSHLLQHKLHSVLWYD